MSVSALSRSYSVDIITTKHEFLLTAHGNTFTLHSENNIKKPNESQKKANELKLFFSDLFSKINTPGVTLPKNTRKISIAIKTKKHKAYTALESIAKLFYLIISSIFGKNSKKKIEIQKKITHFINQLHPSLRKQLEKNFAQSSQDELYLWKYLTSKIDFSFDPTGKKLASRPEILENKRYILHEILKGSYVEFDDNGESYNYWQKEFLSKTRRFSSHNSDDLQFAIRGNLVKECLFSTKSVAESSGSIKKKTWFQLERFPAKWDTHLRHFYTFILYKITGHNQGPYGNSPHREAYNSLKLSLRSPSPFSRIT